MTRHRAYAGRMYALIRVVTPPGFGVPTGRTDRQLGRAPDAAARPPTAFRAVCGYRAALAAHDPIATEQAAEPVRVTILPPVQVGPRLRVMTLKRVEADGRLRRLVVVSPDQAQVYRWAHAEDRHALAGAIRPRELVLALLESVVEDLWASGRTRRPPQGRLRRT